jgi:16S rRNA processing protein RimM
VNPGERLVVGQVRGLHGLRGAVRVESLTDRETERFVAGRQLYVEGATTPLTIVAADQDGPGWRMRFAEVVDRTAAEALRDAYLEVILGPGEGLPAGEFYWHQVIGAKVTDTDGTPLGTVTDVYRAGGAEVAVVAGDRGEFDVPLVKTLVRRFEPASGEMVVDGDALDLRGQPDENGADEAPSTEDEPGAGPK